MKKGITTVKQPNKVAERPQSSDWEICYQTAEHYYKQGVYREAFSWYKKASEFSDCNPIVFFELGYLFQHGEGVDSDSIEALKWYEKAASLGVPQAMYNLAYYYQNGVVVDRDIQRAAQLLRDATSLMDRLQLERDSYEMWKVQHEMRFTALQNESDEKQLRLNVLELHNRELELELTTAKQDCHRLEEEAVQNGYVLRELEEQCETLSARIATVQDNLRKEQTTRKEIEVAASVRQTQLEDRLQASDELITTMISQHNQSFESVQFAYTAGIDALERSYKTDYAQLRESKEKLEGENAELFRLLDVKKSELTAVQEALQQLQIRFEQEKKMKVCAIVASVVFGLLASLLH